MNFFYNMGEEHPKWDKIPLAVPVAPLWKTFIEPQVGSLNFIIPQWHSWKVCCPDAQLPEPPPFWTWLELSSCLEGIVRLSGGLRAVVFKPLWNLKSTVWGGGVKAAAWSSGSCFCLGWQDLQFIFSSKHCCPEITESTADASTGLPKPWKI